MNDRRIAYILIFMLVILGIAAIITGLSQGDGPLPIIAGVAFFAIAALAFFRYSRCPHCKKQMGLRGSLSEKCPHCKKEI